MGRSTMTPPCRDEATLLSQTPPRMRSHSHVRQLILRSLFPRCLARTLTRLRVGQVTFLQVELPAFLSVGRCMHVCLSVCHPGI